MISPNPDNLDHFPEPVAGQPIPRGWFGRLVSFVNSLVLHGENQCFVVKHSANGTTIAPTTALLDALSRSSGSAPAAGGSSTPVSPDYNTPTAVSINTQYGPFSHPVWLTGCVGATLDSSALYEFYLALGALRSFVLFRATQNQNQQGYQISQLIVPVSFLIPPSTSFTVRAITTSPSELYVDLNYYPLI